MPRKNKKYHYIYKTTNVINGKYYIGLHTTDNLDDGYIGSGKRLWYSLKKYGRENFECKILEMFSDRSSLIKREKEIVNEDLLKDTMCMNLCFGGGGWPNNGNAIGGDKFKNANEYWKNPENKEKLKKRMSEQSRKLWNDEEYRKRKSNIKPMLGKKHKPETIEKLRGHKRQVGEKNSQYGKLRSEETKNKIRNSVNLKLGKTNNMNHVDLKKSKRKTEYYIYTYNNIFFSKQRRNKIKEIFKIDISNNFVENIQKVKNILTNMYICENKSTLVISKIFDTNSETIRNYLNLFGIPIRNQYLYKDKM
jgi:hypothetical protein